MTLEIIVSVLLFLCVIMTCIPTMPGIPLMFVFTLVYGTIDGFATMQPWFLVVFGAITLVSMAVDFFSGAIGAKFGGATRKSLLAGMICLFIGLILFPPFGAFIGLFLGIFVAEIVQLRHHIKALKAAAYSLVAAVVGLLVNVVLAVAYFVTFLIVVF